MRPPFLGAALLGLAWLASVAPALAANERSVTLLYTGFTGGLTSGQAPFSELYPFFEGEAPFSVGSLVRDNAMRHGDFLIYTGDGPLTGADFRAFLARGPLELRPDGQAELIDSDHAYLLETGAGAWLTRWLASALARDGGYPDARRRPVRRFAVVNRAGVRLSLLSLTGAAPPMALLEAPSQWEMVEARAVRVNQDGTGARMLAIARPLGDGLRRVGLLERLRRSTTGPVLTIDVGDIVESGASELSSRSRAFTLQRLATMGYDAVVPAENELALEPAEWEQLVGEVPMVAANLTPQAPGLVAPPAVLVREWNGLTVAIIGLVDDVALGHAGVAGPDCRWKASEPQAAARRVVAALAPAHPDAVILATNVRGARLQELRHLQGVTAVIGDFQGLPGEVYRETVTLSGAIRLRTQTPHLIARSSPNRVGELRAVFTGDEPALRRLEGTAHLVTDQLPTDAAWRSQMDLTLDRYQAERRELLLPDLRELIAARPEYHHPDGRMPTLDAALWNRLVANVTREATGAEVAVLRQLPTRSWAAGPLSRLTLEGWLEVGDRLVQTTLSGAALKDLAGRDAEGLLTFSGYDPETGKLAGVAVVDTELYRVTTTDRVVRHAAFGPVFAERPLAERWLKHPDGWARPYAEGEKTMLRELVLSALKGLKSRHGGAFDAAYLEEYARLLTSASALTATRWTIALEDGSLLLNSYQTANTAPFKDVRNTRVTSPSSYALGGRGKLVSVYDSPRLAWENRAKAVYKRATLREDGVEVTQETDDEVVLTSELRLKATPFPLTPFVNGNYVTQFTPDEADGLLKPRRQEINAVTGLVSYPGGGLKELRAGWVVKNDLANPGLLEPGVQVVALYERQLDPWPAIFQAGVDVTHYFATPTDTPDRLGLIADTTAALVIPLWDRFNLSVSADYFLFRGKVPATAQFGSSLDIKVGLGYALGFKPFYGVWY